MENEFRAILINSQTEEITEITLKAEHILLQLRDIIDCRWIESKHFEPLLGINNFPNHTLLCDEDGRRNHPNAPFFSSTFWFNGRQIFGNAIIVKLNDDGYWIAPDITIEQVDTLVTFSTYRKNVVALIVKEKCKELGLDFKQCLFKGEDGGVSLKLSEDKYLYLTNDDIDMVKSALNYRINDLRGAG